MGKTRTGCSRWLVFSIFVFRYTPKEGEQRWTEDAHPAYKWTICITQSGPTQESACTTKCILLGWRGEKRKAWLHDNLYVLIIEPSEVATMPTKEVPWIIVKDALLNNSRMTCSLQGDIATCFTKVQLQNCGSYGSSTECSVMPCSKLLF